MNHDVWVRGKILEGDEYDDYSKDAPNGCVTVGLYERSGAGTLIKPGEFEHTATIWADVDEVERRHGPDPWVEDNRGDKHFFAEESVAQLLKDEVLFVNSRRYAGSFEENPEIKEETLVLFVTCNDTFYYASADALPITYEELPDLYDMHIEDDRWGATKWCCKKKDMRPLPPIQEDMKVEGVWEDWMDELEANPYE